MGGFQASIRVRPGSRTDRAGGQAPPRDRAAASVLEVRVRARPVQGAATAAAERVLADALGLRPRQIRVVRGASTRDKRVEVTDPPPDIAERWAALLELPR